MLLLFDIDGTLTHGGPAKEAFQFGLESVFGTAGPIEDHDFSGKTDPQIARELMTRAGKGSDEIDACTDALWDAYLTELELRISIEPVTVLSGARELISSLNDQPGVWLGLVTGNLEQGARLKLGSVGMAEFFAVGAYGSDHEVRNELPAVAQARAAARWGRDFGGEETVVIGDTPRDVACGRAVGAHTVAVATGRFTRSELAKTEPDLLLSDFSDTAATLDGLKSLFP